MPEEHTEVHQARRRAIDQLKACALAYVKVHGTLEQVQIFERGMELPYYEEELIASIMKLPTFQEEFRAFIVSTMEGK
jgi:hypothetical protein